MPSASQNDDEHIDAAAWARAHDVGTLREIREHREALLTLLRGEPSSEDAILALARLFDTDGADEEVVSALEALLKAPVADPGRGELALARARFEQGKIPSALSHLENASRSEEPETSHSASFALVRLLSVSGKHAEAGARFEAARARYEEGEERWPWVDVLCHTMASGLHMAEGRKQQSLLCAEAAFSAALSYDGAEAPLMAGFIGNVELDLGHFASAERAFATAVKLARRSGARSVEAVFLGYRGWAQDHLGEVQRATRTYRAAIALSGELGLSRFEAQFRALSAAARVTPRNLEQRELECREALASLAATGDQERADGLAVLQVLFDMQRALRAAENGGPLSVEVFHRVATAYARLVAAHEQSDDARLAKRRAQQEFDAVLPQLGADDAKPELAMSPGGASGTGPVGAFSLRRHPNLSRMLWAIALAWSEERAIGDDELVECAWPGERLTPESRTHRLRVAISTLRKQALGPALVRSDGGYRLDIASVLIVPEAIDSD